MTEISEEARKALREMLDGYMTVFEDICGELGVDAEKIYEELSE